MSKRGTQAKRRNDVLRHYMETVPARLSYVRLRGNSNYREAVVPQHERHSLVCGTTRVYGAPTLDDARRILNTFIYAVR